MKFLSAIFLWLLLVHTVDSVGERQIAKERGCKQGSFYYHVHSGFFFHYSYTAEGTRYYKCVRYGRGCRARAQLYFHQGWQEADAGDHSHPPDPLYPDEMALMRRILDRCRRLEYVSFGRIIDEEARRFPPEAVLRVTPGRMRTPMRDARMSQFPQPPPVNLRALTDFLMNPQYSVFTLSDDGEDNVYCGSVDDVEGFHHVIFVSERLLRRLRTFVRWHGDGTFRVVPVSPDYARQVFNIVVNYRHHIIPIAIVLMSSMTRLAYESVFMFLRERMLAVAAQHGENEEIEVDLAIADFEVGQMNAWENIFNVHVQGCLWHLGRALMRRVMEEHLLPHMRQIPELKDLITLTFALPLLRVDLILRGYLLLLRQARNSGDYIFRLVQPYYTYLWNTWISQPVMRERICVFNSAERTNNVCESFNRVLRKEVGNHPNIYKFLCGVVQIEQRAHNHLLSLDRGFRVNSGRRSSSIANDRRVEELSTDLEHPPDNQDAAIMRFLRTARHLMEDLVNEAEEQERR